MSYTVGTLAPTKVKLAPLWWPFCWEGTSSDLSSGKWEILVFPNWIHAVIVDLTWQRVRNQVTNFMSYIVETVATNKVKLAPMGWTFCSEGTSSHVSSGKGWTSVLSNWIRLSLWIIHDKDLEIRSLTVVIHRWNSGLNQSETGPKWTDILLGGDFFTPEQWQKVFFSPTQMDSRAVFVHDTW